MADPDTAGSPSVDVSIRAPLERLEQDLARAQSKLGQFDKVSGHKSLDNLGSAGKRTDAVLAELEDQLGSTARAQIEFDQASAGAAKALAQQNVELSNATSKYEAAAEATSDYSKGMTGAIGETLSMANHLKGVALLAYAAIPAFRALVNPLIVRGFGLVAGAAASIGPAVAGAGLAIQGLGASAAAAGPATAALAPALNTAGAAMARFGAAPVAGILSGVTNAVGPLLSFVSRLAVPVLAIVAAWKLLNAVISTGVELLDKYGNMNRRVFDNSSMAEDLAKITRFQTADDGTVSSSQAKAAAELNTRLDDAKFKLGEALKAQLSLNSAALALQTIWVNIVEKIAEYADRAAKLGPTGTGPEFEKKLEEAGRTPEGGSVFSSKGDFVVDSLRRQLTLARGRLSAALGTAAGSSRDQDKDGVNIGSTFVARWNTITKLLAEGEEKAEKTKSEFDRLEKSMQRSAAAQEAEVKAVDASVGEHARLRAELRLQEAAAQEVAKSGGDIEDYAERIKKLADRFGVAAQKAAELKLKSDIRFTGDTLFLDDTDKQIASILRQIHGKDWKNMMDGPEAGAMRLHAMLKQINDLGGTALAGFAKDVAKGVDPLKAAADQAKRLLESIIDIAAKKVFSNMLGSVFGDTTSMAAGATTAASILTTAGGSVATAIIAGATEAAAILGVSVPTAAATLPVAGAATGVEVAAGGATAGAALAAGGAAAGTAMWGPIGILMAAVAALGALSIFGGKDDQFVKNIKEIQATLERAGGYVQRLLMVGNDTSTLQGKLFAFDVDAAKQRYQELKDGGGAILILEQTLAAERNQIIVDFGREAAEKARQVEQAIADRRIAAQDRVFAAINDNSTLDGALAEFDRRAMREREEEMRLGGEAMVDLEAAQAAERLKVVQGFNDKIIEDTKRAQEELNGAARSILEFVASIQVGPNSSLSPAAQLGAASLSVNNTMVLAQQGNVAALGRITSEIDTELKAARAFYGSSAQYQALQQQRITQLLNLPAAQTATDPLVETMLDVQEAINNLGSGPLATIGGNTSATATNTGTIITNTGTIGTNTGTTAGNTGTTATNTGTTAGNVVNATNAVNALDDPGTIIFQMKDFTKRVVDAINNHGVMTVAGFNNLSIHLAAIEGGTTFMATHNAGSGGFVVGYTPLGAGGGFTYTQAATGGWISGGTPGQDSVPVMAMPGEFVIRNSVAQANASWLGGFNRTGQLPSLSMPTLGANDNVVAVLFSMREEIRRLQDVVAGSNSLVARAVVQEGGKQVDATQEQTERLERTARQQARAA